MRTAEEIRKWALEKRNDAEDHGYRYGSTEGQLATLAILNSLLRFIDEMERGYVKE